MERLYTIGVYGFTPDTFFGTLQEAGVDLLVDIRARRGVRGHEYAFANATRLQEGLAERGIAYRHVLALAPDEETREGQARADAAARIPRRQRTELSPDFVASYTERTLANVDWALLVEELRSFRRPALLCVERVPTACHRGLAARRLAEVAGVPVTDLVP